MSEREEVLNEFGTAECVKRDDCTHFDCVAERKMADEIVRLRTALTTAERERDEAREELERERLRLAACGVAARGESRSVSTIYTSDSLKAVVDLRYRAERAERERDEARRENARLREDAERLDHMAKNCYALSCITDNDGIPRYRASVLFPWVTDFREAIDTARAQARTKEQPE